MHTSRKKKSKTWFHVHCAKHHQHSSHLSPYLTIEAFFPPFFQHISHQECETITKLLASSLSFPPLLAHYTSTQNPHNFNFKDNHIKHFISLPSTNSKRWQGFKEKPPKGKVGNNHIKVIWFYPFQLMVITFQKLVDVDLLFFSHWL